MPNIHVDRAISLYLDHLGIETAANQEHRHLVTDFKKERRSKFTGESCIFQWFLYIIEMDSSLHQKGRIAVGA